MTVLADAARLGECRRLRMLMLPAQQLHERFGKKIWLTEWGCHVFGENPYSCTSEEADKLMLEAISWFRGEGKDIVERWAWFGAFRDMTK